MHKTSAASFGRELHTASPKMVVAVLLGAAALLAQWGDLLPSPDRAWNTALLLFLTAPLGLAIEAWRPAAGRWYALALLSGAIVVAHVWFALPGVLTLLALPVALGAAFAGVPAAAAVASAESGLLLLLVRIGHARPDTAPFTAWRHGRGVTLRTPAPCWKRRAAAAPSCNWRSTTWRWPTGSWQSRMTVWRRRACWPNRRKRPKRLLWPTSATSSAHR